MSFLQPALLLMLPLAALPIVIHLINQRRYQTVRWAAMMFLLAANRMSRGYARLRQWLILAFRVAAIAALALAISRPLAGGWLGLTAGDRVDTTIVVLDRSPSMQQGGGSGATKLEAGKAQLARTLAMLGKSRWVLVDRPSGKPRELESIDALLSSPDAGPSDAKSDLPAMLQVARDYIEANRSGRTDIWICSDLRQDDWDAESGRWQALRDGFLGMPQRVRFHLLAYPKVAPENLAIRVSGVRLQEAGDGSDLLLSLRLEREGAGSGKAVVPVQVEIDGARSEVAVEMVGREADVKDHRIPLGRSRGRGWGRVAIPADANEADNSFWFAYDRPKPRLSVVVSEDPEAAGPLQLAASIAPDPAVTCSTEAIGTDQVASIEWDKVALLLWQSPLPEGDSAKQVQAYLDRGGQVIFVAPKSASDAAFLGMRWTAWVDKNQDVPVDGWRGDQDLLANTQSGSSLPVGQLKVRRYRGLDGEATTLATLKGGAPLLARAATPRGGAYFCATATAPADSSLATEGVVLYVLVQRALSNGASVLEDTRPLVAGDSAGEDPTRWTREAGDSAAISTNYAERSGVYSSGGTRLAVNRPVAEDAAPVLDSARVAGLFRGLDFSRVDDSADNAGSLIQEVWRLFLVGVMVAMVVEAGLCLPKPANPAGVRSS